MPTLVTTYFEPKNSGKFYILEDTYFKGGFRTCANTAERNAIDAGSRKNGMIVSLQDGTYWRLGADLVTWSQAFVGTSVNGRSGVVVLTAADVGLGNVDNVSGANAVVSAAQALADAAVAETAHTELLALQAALNMALDDHAASTTGHAEATQEAAGFLSAADKTKLDGIAAGATNYSLPSTVLNMVSTGVISGTYQAAASERVLLDSTVAGFTVTLPTSPSDQERVDFIDVTGACANNPVLVHGGLHTVEGDTGGLSLNLGGVAISLIYIQAVSNWKLMSTN